RFEAFVRKQAQSRQLDVEQPFVFRVTGDYAHLIWHVVTGENTGGSAGAHSSHGHGRHGGGHANKQSGMKVFRNPAASGQLVGVYSGARLEGVVSHPGERFHLHYIDDGMTMSGHVDQYSVRAGATLWLPVR
ncbi:MAG: acetolactate decarboxylase, partial [Hydrogenophaga sp.]|nr:acetolactate decarboxylase [Hydrogenophaga sp.]